MTISRREYEALRRELSELRVAVGRRPMVNGIPMPTATRRRVQQAAHGFDGLIAVRFNGTAWVRALADIEAHAQGVCLAVGLTEDAFILYTAGTVDGLTGYDPGVTYYLDGTTPGFSTASPLMPVVVPLFQALSASSVVILSREIIPAPPPSSTDRTQQQVEQTAHGFAVGDAVGGHNNTWFLSQNDDEAKAWVSGIVSYVEDADHFTVTTSGKVDVANGVNLILHAGVCWLSDVPGELTRDRPTTRGQFAVPVLFKSGVGSGGILMTSQHTPAVDDGRSFVPWSRTMWGSLPSPAPTIGSPLCSLGSTDGGKIGYLYATTARQEQPMGYLVDYDVDGIYIAPRMLIDRAGTAGDTLYPSLTAPTDGGAVPVSTTKMLTTRVPQRVLGRQISSTQALMEPMAEFLLQDYNEIVEYYNDADYEQYFTWVCPAAIHRVYFIACGGGGDLNGGASGDLDLGDLLGPVALNARSTQGGAAGGCVIDGWAHVIPGVTYYLLIGEYGNDTGPGGTTRVFCTNTGVGGFIAEGGAIGGAVTGPGIPGVGGLCSTTQPRLQRIEAATYRGIARFLRQEPGRPGHLLLQAGASTAGLNVPGDGGRAIGARGRGQGGSLDATGGYVALAY